MRLALLLIVLAALAALALVARADEPSPTLLVHVVGDANENDADGCVAFNVAWTAVERGQDVVMLFDSWAGYNVKVGDFWARYQVPPKFANLVAGSAGHDLDWNGGSYLDLLRYLHEKGMTVVANGTFLSLSGDDKKLPPFVRPLELTELTAVLQGADAYVRY